jgi:5-(carboxyamino)imidazole ribonucleotide synthase
MTAAAGRKPIPPGSTLGVLGGGQLGRMFVHAAQAMGYETAVLDPDPASPAGRVAHHHVHAEYLDAQSLRRMADLSDAVTTEFENVPASALAELADLVPVAPGADAVRACQDRAAEKAQFARCAVPCAPYAVIEREDQLAAAPDTLLPGILKTSRLGYDGKGQVAVASRAELGAAWEAFKRVPCVLERRLQLRSEVSVIVARGYGGEMVNFPVQQNLHRGGILAVTQVPPPDVDDALALQAVEAARRIAGTLQYAGVLCVEFFVLEDGSLLANEMAPRPHNSGHYTIDACDVSQFELQVRTMAGLPLVAPRLHSPAVMLNLLGDLWFRAGARPVEPPWHEVLALPGAHLHLYGKVDPRPGRKMGHLTLTAPDAASSRDVARAAAARLGIEPF